MEKVNTNKKQYNKPMLISEEFVPQEYVAVCYELACDYGKSDKATYNPYHSDDDGHRKQTDGKGCGWASNQSIQTNAEGVIIGVSELNSPIQNAGILKCNFNPDITGQNIKDLNGQKVTWTSAFNNYIFYHEGTVTMIKQGSPNHS